MADRGIIFSAPMVRALLDGRKTQTRRRLKGVPEGARYTGIHYASDEPDSWFFNSPKGPRKLRVSFEPGDRLYVREAFSYDRLDIDRDGTLPPWYWADGNIADAKQGSGNFTKPKPSIHMPRWASRLTLLVTDVRVQRVAEISEEDARAEGATPRPFEFMPAAGLPDGFRVGFAHLWNSLHTKPGERWEDNPWIVAVRFTVHHGNIDQIHNEGRGGRRKTVRPEQFMTEAKGVPVTDWSWWVGTDEGVREEGLYDLNECYSREDAIAYGEANVEPGERFHIVEARCRELRCDDEFQPFAASRSHAVFEVNTNGDAVEVTE